MTVSRPRLLFVGLSIIVFLSLSACAGLSRRPDYKEAVPTGEARQLLANLSNINPSLTAFKGIGKIKIWHPDRPAIKERVAWVGSSPESLRIEVLISGRSVIKFSTDGYYMYYLDLREAEPSLTKFRTVAPNLKHIAALPIKIREVIHLLAGRPPLENYSKVYLIEDSSGEGFILILENWWRIVQKIYIDRDKSQIRKVEVFKDNRRLRYSAVFNRMQQARGYLVPGQLTLTDEKGAGLVLDIDRYVADVSTNPSTFVLSPPGVD